LMSVHFEQLVQCLYVMPHYTGLGIFVFVRYSDMCISMCSICVLYAH
jgi:hypothetical protein